jgi:diguanylate cyclase (GGDEF)-like protein
MRGRAASLRTRLEGRDALVDAIRETNASVDSRTIADWLVKQAHGWLAAPSWTVVAHDHNGHLNVLAEAGLPPQLGPSLWSAANWVMRHGDEFYAANLAVDARSRPGAVGTAVAFPLICRGRTIGALVGLDPVPSTTAPALGPLLVAALRTVLSPVGIAIDNALALQKAQAASVTDDLTRLFNSRHLTNVLSRETKRALRTGRPLSLLFVDLDGFKQINDCHGHLVGSKALTEVAAIARRCARETDIVARFGGDEFAFVLPDTSADGALAVAVRIAERIRRFRFLADEGLDVRLTCSIGVATLPGAAGSGDDLLRASDRAMYRVKADGKDGIHVAGVE